MDYESVCRIILNGIPSNSWCDAANGPCDELDDPSVVRPPLLCLFRGRERAKIDGGVWVGSAFEGRAGHAAVVFEVVRVNATV